MHFHWNSEMKVVTFIMRDHYHAWWHPIVIEYSPKRFLNRLDNKLGSTQYFLIVRLKHNAVNILDQGIYTMLKSAR